MTELIAGSAARPHSQPGAETCALLGAGNCNDISLATIVPRFSQVHLLDIDREAITRARERQPAPIAERLVLHAPIDLGGALSQLQRWRSRSATPEELGRLSSAAAETALRQVTPRFDLVVSTCILSQLVHGCQRFLGDEHPQLEMIACAVVVAHLRLWAQLVKPGGAGLLLTDTVSSDTYPLEELWGQRSPWALVDELEATGNHLSGTTPRFVRRIVNTDPTIAPLVESSDVEEPWLWTLSDVETYLVWGLRFNRRP